jgi:hypothetical protein
VHFPVSILAAFDRVFVPAGQSTTVTLRVAPRQLQYWSTPEGKWVTAVSQRTVSVGALECGSEAAALQFWLETAAASLPHSRALRAFSCPTRDKVLLAR